MLRRDAVRMIDSKGKYKEHNRDVLTKLKAAYRDSDNPDLHYSVYLPNNLRFTLSKVNCEIYIECEQVVHNMQLDTAAFDSWALILNAWLNLDVSLAWDPPPISDPPETDEEKLIWRHYQRFLYRVIRFLDVNEDWFSVKDDCDYLQSSRVLTPDGELKEEPGYFRIRPPSLREQDSCGIDRPEVMNERSLEKWFSCDPGRGVLLSSLQWPEDEASLTRQVPVGLFDGVPSDDNTVLSGKKAAVDLGAKYSKEVALFELKAPGNCKVGSLSEILFYSHVIRDLQLKNFGYHKTKIVEKGLDFSDAESVRSFILADRLHPLLRNTGLFRVLNEAFSNRNESFGFIQYFEDGNTIKCEQPADSFQ